jgi:cytochrome c-type biogenesis protein CcmF
MTYLGQFALWAAVLVGAWGAALAFFGKWEERPALATAITRSSYALCAALLVAAVALWKGIFTHDFNIEYVAAYTSRNLPEYYLISAFWAGQKGSLLFWAVVLSIFGALAQALTSQRFKAMLPYVAGIANVTTIFFVLVMLFGGANPFERLAFTPPDGRGLNPQLQNPGMIIHPPMLYLGYISLTIPFAFAMAALLAKQLDAGWIVAMRKWALTSWLFLSVGITIGMWWAYVELGWGGVWAWDPVENASLLPWLTLTAFLHSVMIQEKRGMLKRWNMGLIVATFLLTIFGTFITRSGVIASVHSFTQSAVGYFFLAFLMVAAILSFTLLYTRWPLLQPEAQLESMVSREGAFLYNNLALVGIAFSVLWGTLFPILSEAVRGTKITVGPPFFNRVNIPLGIFLLFLTGVGPLIAWRKASAANLRRQFIAPLIGGGVALGALLAGGLRSPWAVMSLSVSAFALVTVIQEFGRGIRARMTMHAEGAVVALMRLVARNRRRYGGYVVHVAIMVYFVAFTGLAFATKTTVDLQPGQTATLKSAYGHTWTFTHLGVSQYEALNRRVSAATLEIAKDGVKKGTIKSEKRQHVDSFGNPTFEPSTEVGIRSDLLEDVYVVYAGSPDGTERASFSLLINPLVSWFWIGGGILVFGGLLTMWPGGPQVKTARQRASIQAGYTVPLAGVAE